MSRNANGICIPLIYTLFCVVRLPKDVAFPAGVKDVAVLKDGKRRIIVPVDAQWDGFFDAPRIDLGQRDQPEPQRRDDF